MIIVFSVTLNTEKGNSDTTYTRQLLRIDHLLHHCSANAIKFLKHIR